MKTTKNFYSVYDKEDTYNEGECLESFDTEDDARDFVNTENAGYGYAKLYYKEEVVLTFDLQFNDNQNSNCKGFSESNKYCMEFIKKNNGTNESYFKDYKGGTVSIVCNETKEVMYNTVVIF